MQNIQSALNIVLRITEDTQCSILTEQFTVTVVDGEVPQGSGHCPNHAVIAMCQQLCHHGKTLLQTHSGPDIPTILNNKQARREL